MKFCKNLAGPALLAEALNHCESLRTLDLNGTRLDDEGVAELAAGLEDGALPALEFLMVMAKTATACAASARSAACSIAAWRRRCRRSTSVPRLLATREPWR